MPTPPYFRARKCDHKPILRGWCTLFGCASFTGRHPAQSSCDIRPPARRWHYAEGKTDKAVHPPQAYNLYPPLFDEYSSNSLRPFTIQKILQKQRGHRDITIDSIDRFVDKW